LCHMSGLEADQNSFEQSTFSCRALPIPSESVMKEAGDCVSHRGRRRTLEEGPPVSALRDQARFCPATTEPFSAPGPTTSGSRDAAQSGFVASKDVYRAACGCCTPRERPTRGDGLTPAPGVVFCAPCLSGDVSWVGYPTLTRVSGLSRLQLPGPTQPPGR